MTQTLKGELGFSKVLVESDGIPDAGSQAWIRYACRWAAEESKALETKSKFRGQVRNPHPRTLKW